MDEPLVPHLQNRGTNSRGRPCILTGVVFLIISIVLAGFALGFFFSPQDSEFVVTKFYVPALDLIIVSNSSTISFDLVIWDKIDDAEIQYHDIHVTLYYGKEPSFPVANVTIPGFHQYANFNDGTPREITVTTTGMPWGLGDCYAGRNANRQRSSELHIGLSLQTSELPSGYGRCMHLKTSYPNPEMSLVRGLLALLAKQEVISNETTTFHLNLKTRYKYSKLFGWSKSCFVDVGGDIPVNREGKMARSTDVKLS